MTNVVKALLVVISLFAIIIFLISIIWLVAGKSHDKFSYILKVLSTLSWTTFAFLGTPWAFSNYYLRYFLAGAFVLLLVISVYKTWQHRFWVRKSFSFYLGFVYILLGLGLGVTLDVLVIKGYYYNGEPAEISSPFKGGEYAVIQGGNSPVMNLFHFYFKEESLRYALDIVKIDSKGFRASGLLPDSVEQFEIWGDTVYSPCNGRVYEMVNNVDDNRLGELSYESATGNHVIIECENFYIILAHMQKGSVMVTNGQQVKAGTPLGLVGNSGYTIEPHLHLNAFRLENGPERSSIPMLINGEFKVLNSLFEESP